MAAYRAGLAKLESGDATDAVLPAVGQDDFSALDVALDRLRGASMSERRTVLRALAVTMRHDQRANVAEAEIFRTIAAALGCPVPPATRIG